MVCLYVISCHQSWSVIISHYWSSSVIISCHQSSSVTISCHQLSSDVISCHQLSSIIISHHQSSSLMTINTHWWWLIKVVPIIINCHLSQLLKCYLLVYVYHIHDVDQMLDSNWSNTYMIFFIKHMIPMTNCDDL